jgi:DNA-directed RNA polymerase omega subunit
MPQYISRGASIDTEKCVKESGGNRFDLIIMATQRAREIKQRNQHSMKEEHLHGVVTALLEIQDGNVEENWERKIR